MRKKNAAPRQKRRRSTLRQDKSKSSGSCLPDDDLGEKMQKLTEKLQAEADARGLLRVTLSGHFGKTVKKISYTPATHKKEPSILEERFMPDGKALHAFLPVKGCAERILKESVLRSSAFFMVQFSHPHMILKKNMALAVWTFVDKVMSLHVF